MKGMALARSRTWTPAPSGPSSSASSTRWRWPTTLPPALRPPKGHAVRDGPPVYQARLGRVERQQFHGVIEPAARLLPLDRPDILGNPRRILAGHDLLALHGGPDLGVDAYRLEGPKGDGHDFHSPRDIVEGRLSAQP